MDIKYKEVADKAAKQACISLNFPVPHFDMKLAVNSFIRQKCQKEWDGQTKNKLNEIKLCIETLSAFTSRKSDVIFTRLRIGHSMVDAQIFDLSRK